MPRRSAPPLARWTPSGGSRPTGSACSHCTPGRSSSSWRCCCRRRRPRPCKGGWTLEKAAPRAFARLFSLVLTDNGSEFAACDALERSAVDPAARRSSVYYCDVRQSQQKGGCERNHVEVRKILPKGRGVSFDRLDARDCAALMSHLNSEPRPALGGMCAIDMLLAALGDDGRELLDALGIGKVAYEDLDMTIGAIESGRRRRGEGPLMP